MTTHQPWSHNDPYLLRPDRPLRLLRRARRGCHHVERPFGTLTSCGGFDGVLHGTDTPSGIRVRTFIGDRWMDIYLNDTLIDSTSLSGQLILVDDEEPGVLVNHQSFCRSFLTPDGDPVHVSVDSMIVDGEGIYFDVSEVDSCD
jgi:hypothetical protein